MGDFIEFVLCCVVFPTMPHGKIDFSLAIFVLEILISFFVLALLLSCICNIGEYL